jgi:hypothetical protein
MYLYLIGAFDYNNDILAVKIGVSNDIAQRIAAIQTGQFCDVKLLAAWETDSRMKCFHVEKTLHENYAQRRMRGEWFRRIIMRDAIPLVNDLMGSIPCSLSNVTGHLSELRDAADRKVERNRRYRESKRLRKQSLKLAG